MQEVSYFWNGSVFKLRKTVDGKFVHTVNDIIVDKEHVPFQPLIFLETQAQKEGWGRTFDDMISM